ncbi:class I SAM-dependent methyltransferase [Quadrisphaera setariae]|uniref:Class I SAM-dependent methyltransferase n=1 Tax=Quadrisphaera setariae TaxID=2593304 RepID=A0A5C8ZKT4_9ACTN|nr:class I SAM-dependent methyltransferase [Quadrisphaera setariae]TXR57758.1 class I SAM-dependent methyltransferase [Quadrisphaera setariae]
MAAPPARQAPPTLVDANRVWVDSWLRHQVGLHLEGPALARLGAHGEVCVEVGTGRRGLGARVAVDRFGARRVTAVDLHPASVDATRRRTRDLAARPGVRVDVLVADAEALPLPDASADLLVSFHALHHADDWRAVLAEAARVVRPGGQLALTEMTSRIVDAPWLRAVSHHPDGRFSSTELLDAVTAAGFEVAPERTRRWSGDRVVQAVAVRTTA